MNWSRTGFSTSADISAAAWATSSGEAPPNAPPPS